jgi:2-dehydro-3-deoxyglucarate aldolase/4-hydroxy-2-oxoheptanedioate aldolase
VRENPVKRALRGGGVAFGTMMFEFPTTGIARAAAAAGAEFAIFDMEHTGWSIETVRMLMSTSRAADLVPMVRVPAAQYHLISRPLDVGAMGIMVPMVGNEADARLIVQSAKYPPLGRRGAAFGVAHDDYRSDDLVATLRSSNDEVFLIAQIETTDGLDSVEKIAAVDGIDCLWIGHFDLTNSMGIPGQFTHPRYLGAVERVVETSQRHGKAAGFMVASVEQGRELLARGFRILAYWGDLWIYQQALRQGLQGLREGAPRHR